MTHTRDIPSHVNAQQPPHATTTPLAIGQAMLTQARRSATAAAALPPPV